MRQYKLVLLLKSDLKKEEKDKIVETAKKLAGKTEKETVTDLGSKKLAYKVAGVKKGDYVLIEFSTENLSKEFDKKIKLDENLLRHLLVRVD